MTATVRPVAKTPAQRRVAEALALEPGGPPSRQARVTGRIMKHTLRTIWAMSPASPAGLRGFRRVTAMQESAGSRPPEGVEIVPADFGRFGGEWVRAGRALDERRRGKVILYLHGGAYFFGSPKTYRSLGWRLSAATARSVLLVDYRLAPEHTPTDALEDALTAYESLVAGGHDAEDIVIAGDSAGGHLALATVLALRDRGLPMPRALVCISPWADLACSAESHTLNRRTDSVIPANRLAWLGRSFCEGKERSDPLLAPVNGDYTGLPPLMVISTDNEILSDDARTVTERARAAGVDVVHHEWRGLLHVFPVFADFIPEGKAACRHIADFLRRVA